MRAVGDRRPVGDRRQRFADAFWSLDARIGAAGDMSGTTAAVLLVDGWNMPGVVNLRCVLANVGDSRGLRVDMRSPAAAALPFATRKHTPADADEVNRLKLTVRVRDQLSRMRAGAADSSTIRTDASSVRSTYSAYATSRRPSSERSAAGSERSAASSADDTPATLDEKARARAFTRAELDAALASLGVTLDGGSDAADASLLLRGLQREARMELSERRLHPTLRRENSGLGKRFDTWGPVVLKSARFRVVVQAVRGSFRRGTRVRAEPEEQPRTVPVSTAVTRSVGDWDAARTLIPHPDLYRFDVGSSQHERVVLASDGVGLCHAGPGGENHTQHAGRARGVGGAPPPRHRPFARQVWRAQGRRLGRRRRPQPWRARRRGQARLSRHAGALLRRLSSALSPLSRSSSGAKLSGRSSAATPSPRAVR